MKRGNKTMTNLAPRLLIVFRVTYWLAVILLFIAAILVTASFFIADRPPSSPSFWSIGVVVSSILVAIGLLVLGIQRRAAAIAQLLPEGKDATGLTVHLRFLLIYLTIGGVSLCIVMVMIASAVVWRIAEGFAVFG